MSSSLLVLSLIVTFALNWGWKARRKLVGLSIAIYGLAIAVTLLYLFPNWWRWLRGSGMYVGLVPLLLALANSRGQRTQA